MIEIARLLSRPEALTVQAMFDAYGISSHLGGDQHGATQVLPIALGGYRLTVPIDHYDEACDLLREVTAEPLPDHFVANRRRLLRLMLYWSGFCAIFCAPLIYVASAPVWLMLMIPGELLLLPVPAQGRGDYYLGSARSI